MTSLTFTFTSSAFYYSVLTGTKAAPVFHSKNKIVLPANYDIPRTVLWFETQLDLLLNNIQPDVVTYKLTINNVTNNYVSAVYYGQAMLNLLCQKKGLEISYVSPSAIVASKLNQPRNANLYDYLDNTIGKHPPYWDKTMKDTTLIALIHLP